LNKKVEKGKTLLVDGPASVDIVSGTAEVFGAVLKEGRRVLIRSGKRLPFEAKTPLSLNVMMGEGASIEEVEGTTIPASWAEAYETVRVAEKPLSTIVILGAVDSGKTSLCTYLCNRLLSDKRRIAIIDGDLGQSDIGPPSTIGYAIVKKPLIDPFDLNAERCCFVGFTTPSKARETVVQRLVEIKNELSEKPLDYVIINTDGWVEGKEAVEYKARLIEEVEADIIVGIQDDEVLAPILETVAPRKTVICESPSFVKKRGRDERKLLRELCYKKYLKNAKVRSFPLSWVTVKGLPLSFVSNYHNVKQMRSLQRSLGVKIFHYEEKPDKAFVVIGRNKWINEEQISKFEKECNKKLVILREGDEEGLLVALENARKEFLGIGVIRGIDYRRKAIKLYTPVSDEISTIHVGKIVLDKNMKEIVSPSLISDYSF